jgi:hypothetical protein
VLSLLSIFLLENLELKRFGNEKSHAMRKTSVNVRLRHLPGKYDSRQIQCRELKFLSGELVDKFRKHHFKASDSWACRECLVCQSLVIQASGNPSNSGAFLVRTQEIVIANT